MIDGRLVPRPMIVRVFAARTGNGWTIMPGGYARIGRTGDPTALAMQDGGSVADVWVVSETPVRHDSLSAPGDAPFVRRMPGVLPARAADNLYWLGRYVERAEYGVRMLRAYHVRLAEAGAEPGPMLDHLAAAVGALGHDPAVPFPASLLALLDLARSCAGKIRDRFSTDGWNALNQVAAFARRSVGAVAPGDDAVRATGELLRELAAFSGLIHDNMFRFAGWRFLTMGRALERGSQIAGLLAGYADVGAPNGSFDVALEVGDSVMTHRRRYSVETNRNTVVDLLALDGDNPRSVLFQVETLREQQARLPEGRSAARMEDVARRILRVHTGLAVAVPEEITTERLLAMREELAGISDALSARYLS